MQKQDVKLLWAAIRGFFISEKTPVVVSCLFFEPEPPLILFIVSWESKKVIFLRDLCIYGE